MRHQALGLFNKNRSSTAAVLGVQHSPCRLPVHCPAQAAQTLTGGWAMDSGGKYLKLHDVAACCVPSALIVLLHRVTGC